MSDVRVVMARPHRLLDPIIARIKAMYDTGSPCVFLVPEQYTLQAEREVMSRLALPGLFSIEVLSPTRLIRRVTEAAGTDDRTPLSSAGQQMAVSFALEACADKLHFYHASASRRGFAQKLTALIADMKRGGLLPESLAAYANTLPDGMHKEKFNDLQVLYQAYQDVLKDRLGDGDDLNRYITDSLAESGLMHDRHVFVFGFDAMSEQLITLLGAIGKIAKSLTVGLIAAGAGAADADVYLPVRQSVARFRAALDTAGVPLREELMPDTPLPAPPEIRYLDEMLFAYPQKRFPGTARCVRLSYFNSPFAEATAVSRQIMGLLQAGQRLDRIAVLYPDQNGYPFAVSAALADSGLPYYTDEKLPALSHGLPQFIMAALQSMAGNFRSDDVLAMLKTGYAAVSFEEAATLESYVREFGINYGRWLQPFTKGEEDRRSECEKLRQRIIQPLITARASIVAARTASQSLEALMKLLVTVDAYHALKQEEEQLLAQGLLVRAGQNSQIWQAVLELFDQLHILSSDKRIPLKYIAERFETGFSAISLAALPPSAGMLHAGLIGHSLSGEMDAVFLLGMNDGVLTKTAESLLTEEERAQAQEGTQTYLGLTEDSRLRFAKIDIKSAMTLPKKLLYLSYAKTDPAGNTLQPLDLITEMETVMFEDMPAFDDHPDMLPLSAQQAMVILGDLLRDFADGDRETLPAIWNERLSKLLTAQGTAEHTLRLLRAAGYRVETLPLSADAARSLFGDRALSVSRLEEFAACPYRHFVFYGLAPQEQKEWEITPIETGNFFHDSLQRFAEQTKTHPQFPNISSADVEQMVDSACKPLEDELLHGPMGDGPRSLAAMRQAKRIVNRACLAVTEHIAAGQFVIEKTEALFGYPGKDSFPPVMLRLADGTEISLHGRIDRIDRYTEADTPYRRVVDYKSGSSASLNAAELWHGTQLQLMLYLNAVTGNTGEAKPAGAFYFHLFDPVSGVRDDVPGAVAADLQKQLQMDGLALDDTHVLRAMDTAGEAVAIPSPLTKAGAVRKGAKVLDKQHMDALIRHAKGKAAQFAQQILDGDISIQPVKHGAKESCTYCDYRTVCGFDPLARGAHSREIFTIPLEELTRKLDEESN